MKRIKSVLHSSMAQQRMYNLALLNCEQDIDLKMDFTNIIDLCTVSKKQENTVLSVLFQGLEFQTSFSSISGPKNNPPCSRPLALISALRAYSAVSSNSLSFPPMRKGLDKNIGSAHFWSQRMHQNAGFCIKSIQKYFRGSQPPDRRGGRGDICSHQTRAHAPNAGAPLLLRLATALVTGQRFRPGSLSVLGSTVGSLAGYWVDPQPPKGFPLFSALRMATPDTIILLMLDHHAAIGGKSSMAPGQGNAC